jgi:hypothetical protein
VLKGLNWLDLQQVAAQLTSLSMNYTSPLSYAPDRQVNTQMLAGLAQLSELRHLDTGNCNFVPTDGALRILLHSYSYATTSPVVISLSTDIVHHD